MGLAWGDPSLYDSTLRILEQVLAGGAMAFEYEVIPGVTSIQTLAAKHRLPLNGIGEGIHPLQQGIKAQRGIEF